MQKQAAARIMVLVGKGGGYQGGGRFEALCGINGTDPNSDFPPPLTQARPRSSELQRTLESRWRLLFGLPLRQTTAEPQGWLINRSQETIGDHQEAGGARSIGRGRAVPRFHLGWRQLRRFVKAGCEQSLAPGRKAFFVR